MTGPLQEIIVIDGQFTNVFIQRKPVGPGHLSKWTLEKASVTAETWGEEDIR